ncbi:Spy/CpxP family protein refolding chaperone [Mesorhizobium jarvisii]|uniref:Spy/CpxP family protein refolding chaperone n=1 Tax=Mesorhizobium jarvisii TaxID=1777867 RepID=UPI001F0B1D2E|nr:Spy/CpxP family protein refolding chaperone [Mesorhizobium jarvisii]MCH4559162.1 Spy/CpxP family protein refolding chaperone [Mesorhizobium jarvisii]
MFNARSVFAAGLLLTVVATPAVAGAEENDSGWWPRWGMGRMMMGQWGGPMGDYDSDEMLDRIDGRLAFLRTELKITDEQAPVWDELAGVIRSTAEAHNVLMRGMIKEFREGNFLKKPLPERLAYQQTHLEARLEQVKLIRAAVEKLYATLSDQQKKAADEIVLPTMGMGMGRSGGFGPGMMFR